MPMLGHQVLVSFNDEDVDDLNFADYKVCFGFAIHQVVGHSVIAYATSKQNHLKDHRPRLSADSPL